MTISVFQALALLPDGEQFVLYVRRLDRRTQTAKLKRQRQKLNVEQAVSMVEASGSSRIVKKTGVGYMVAAGQHFIKADGKKAKAFTDSCGLKFKRKKQR